MTMKPVHEHPDLAAIWKRLYVVELPEMYLRDEEDIRSRGTFTTGNAEKDMTHQHSYSRAYRTINQIFELWKQGVNVYVVKYEDTEKIYYAIEKHLSNWYNYLKKGVSINTCPFDELLELDRFANTVYDKAKYVFTEESMKPIQSPLTKLGISLNPMDFRFGKSKNRIRFNHAFKSDSEVLMEQGIHRATYSERKGFENDLLEVASRYDVRLNNAPKEEVKPLSLELKFGNK